MEYMPVIDIQAEAGVLRTAWTILGVSGQWIIYQDPLTKSRGGGGKESHLPVLPLKKKKAEFLRH